jgi:hypothetical protein
LNQSTAPAADTDSESGCSANRAIEVSKSRVECRLASMKFFLQCQRQGMNLGKAVRSRLLASLALAALVALLGLSLCDPGWRPGAVVLIVATVCDRR